jgi:hypothetical protein
MTTAPKRRWFQWSLRTLFVVVTAVALLVGWIVYQLSWMRERRELVNRVESYAVIGVGGGLAEAPWPLWLFGEQGYSGILLHFPDPNRNKLVDRGREKWEQAERLLKSNEQIEVARVRRLFPECPISVTYLPAQK